MLQQTQVERVIPKYKDFLKKFSTVEKLAKAKQSEVLKLWLGLGYNRRALYLKRTAETIVSKHKGKFPKTIVELEELPGVGPYTAGAIATFAYNQSHVFIETNIRSVFIHEFFSHPLPASPSGRGRGNAKVSDNQLLPLIEKTLDQKNPREWYGALMDYGSFLKKTNPNPSKRSKHHVTQSKFKGSARELRGRILKTVSEKPMTESQILKLCAADVRTTEILRSLVREGFLAKNRNIFSISA